MSDLRYAGKTQKELLHILIGELEKNNEKTERVRVLLEGIDGNNGMKSVQEIHSKKIEKLEFWKIWVSGGIAFVSFIAGWAVRLGKI